MTLSLVVQPVQILVGIGLLIGTLGYSALVGLLVSDTDGLESQLTYQPDSHLGDALAR